MAKPMATGAVHHLQQCTITRFAATVLCSNIDMISLTSRRKPDHCSDSGTFIL